MNKNRRAETRKDEIGATWEVPTVQAESETPMVQTAPQQHFGFRVLAADTAHVEPPLLGCQNIGHALLTISRPGATVALSSPRICLLQGEIPGFCRPGIPADCSHRIRFAGES